MEVKDNKNTWTVKRIPILNSEHLKTYDLIKNIRFDTSHDLLLLILFFDMRSQLEKRLYRYILQKALDMIFIFGGISSLGICNMKYIDRLG